MSLRGSPARVQAVSVSVASVLQTVAGKMIFAHLRDNGDEMDQIDRNVRNYGPRPRRGGGRVH